MGERIELFLFIAAGGGGFGLLGAAFGGVTGVWLHSSGRAAGVFGLLLLGLWQRTLNRPLSGRFRAVAGGAIDGGLFLGVVGGAVGGWGQASGQGVSWVLKVGGVAALLALGAVLFGTIGYSLVRRGVRSSGPVLIGAAVGAFVGACWCAEAAVTAAAWLGVGLRGSDPMFVALLGGALIGGGLGAMVAAGRTSSRQPPAGPD